MTGKRRVLWLLNHTTLRRFDLAQFKALGIDEIFTPKSFPFDEGNISATVDHSLDAALSISRADLEVLNQQDWYGAPSEEAWRIANRHFDIAVVGFFPAQLGAVVRNFSGAVVLRIFGLEKGLSYSRLIYEAAGERLLRDIRAIGSRFWFGAGYEHLHECESDYMAGRNCYLPVGLEMPDTAASWEGDLEKIFFVCPRIGSTPYFNRIYEDFLESFGGLAYTVAGAQPVAVDDPNVIGFVSRAQHDTNMKRHRVMFYHSTEPNHVHYHPFEAVASGMPLVFMAGSLLDRMGGTGLPGRSRNLEEARKKIGRLLRGDRKLIESIRRSQTVLLQAVKPENCAPAWREGFRRILGDLETSRLKPQPARNKPKRIAVVLPLGYRGGSLRAAKLLAQAVYRGSRDCNEPAEVVFLHLRDRGLYSDDAFVDLPPQIKLRPFNWRALSVGEARRAMRYAGHEDWQPSQSVYVTVDDRISQLQDCDLCVIVSDRVPATLLPLRPYCLMVYDYIQRYVPGVIHGSDQICLDTARRAEKVLVTTEFTQRDVLQYAGVPADKVAKLPMIAPYFPAHPRSPRAAGDSPYFLWTTNAGEHKNHHNAFKALRRYYEELAGELDCVVTGVNTLNMLKDSPHLREAASLLQESERLKKRVHIRGELSESGYRDALAGAAFLWHAGRIDNGTFSVVEAASLGVPSLSSEYPAMREIDEQFALNMAWMDAADPESMADALKVMEGAWRERQALLPSRTDMAAQHVDRLARAYWMSIRECL